MDNKTYSIREDLTLHLILGMYVISGIFLFRYYKYPVDGDLIAYISIAQKYMSGNFKEAINGFWSPLYSWLLFPFLALDIKPLSAVRMQTLIVGFLTLIGIRLMTYRFELGTKIRNIIIILFLPIIFSIAITIITPDLLLACAVLFYLWVVFDAEYYTNKRKVLLCGALGAVSYLSKSYGFPFFCAHFTFVNVVYYFKNKSQEKRKSIVRSFFYAMTVFLAISGIWITTISIKYDKVMLSSAGKFNYAALGPHWGWEKGSPSRIFGFLKPTYETSIGLEDPYYDFMKFMKPWSPLESWDAVKYEVNKIMSDNILRLWIELRYPLSFTIILLVFVLFCTPFDRSAIPDNIIYLLLTMLLYGGGYILVHVERRYLLPSLILMVILDGYLIERLFKSDFLDSKASKITLGVLVSVFAFITGNGLIRDLGVGKGIFFKSFYMYFLVGVGYIINVVLNKSFPGDEKKKAVIVFFMMAFLLRPFKTLFMRTNSGKNVYELSLALSDHNIKNANIAESRQRNIWGLYTAFYLNNRYYGVPKEDISVEELEKELKKYDIDYYFVWNNKNFKFLSDYKEMTGGAIKNLQVYRVGGGR